RARAVPSCGGCRARVSRQAVIRELVPRRGRSRMRVILRPDPGIAVERAKTDRDLGPVRPRPAEQARAADRAERLRHPVWRPVDADQLLPRKEPEPLARDAALGQAERSRMLAAAGAVAVVGPAEQIG